MMMWGDGIVGYLYRFKATNELNASFLLHTHTVELTYIPKTRSERERRNIENFCRLQTVVMQTVTLLYYYLHSPFNTC